MTAKRLTQLEVFSKANATKLREYYESGEFSFFALVRYEFWKSNLSKEEKEVIKRIDDKLKDAFTVELLELYAREMEELPIKLWWSK